MQTTSENLALKPGDSAKSGAIPLVSTTAGLIGKAVGELGGLVDPRRPNSYAAFISYSHRDMKLARWLHKAIENYRVPRALVGTQGEFGPVPARLRPVFRDEDELAGAAELGPKLENALANSRALIVICSPASARSAWVDKEIRTFKRLNPAAPVLAMIADGVPSDPERDCFPKPLLWGITPDGELDPAKPAEPLAPDYQKLDRRAVKLKLIAGMIGVPYSALFRRDQRRARMLTAVFSTAALILLAIMSVLTITAMTYAKMAVKERNAAVAARAVAVKERNDAIAARDLAERRTWLAQQAADQIRSFADAACPPSG